MCIYNIIKPISLHSGLLSFHVGVESNCFSPSPAAISICVSRLGDLLMVSRCAWHGCFKTFQVSNFDDFQDVSCVLGMVVSN